VFVPNFMNLKYLAENEFEMVERRKGGDYSVNGKPPGNVNT